MQALTQAFGWVRSIFSLVQLRQDMEAIELLGFWEMFVAGIGAAWGSKWTKPWFAWLGLNGPVKWEVDPDLASGKHHFLSWALWFSSGNTDLMNSEYCERKQGNQDIFILVPYPAAEEEVQDNGNSKAALGWQRL